MFIIYVVVTTYNTTMTLLKHVINTIVGKFHKLYLRMCRFWIIHIPPLHKFIIAYILINIFINLLKNYAVGYALLYKFKHFPVLLLFFFFFSTAV